MAISSQWGFGYWGATPWGSELVPSGTITLAGEADGVGDAQISLTIADFLLGEGDGVGGAQVAIFGRTFYPLLSGVLGGACVGAAQLGGAPWLVPLAHSSFALIADMTGGFSASDMTGGFDS
jgi:hypothetical protein